MTRFFALPVMATVLALVGVRMLAVPAPVEPLPTVALSSPAQEPEAAPSPIVTPEGLWETTPPAAPPAPPPPAPRMEPMIIVLEPLPAPPARVEIVNNPVVAPQTTVIQAPVNNFYPVVEIVPPPAQDVVEIPVAVAVGVPVCAAHRRPGCCLQKPVIVPQDTFFKKTPFLPPTPRRGRWEP